MYTDYVYPAVVSLLADISSFFSESAFGLFFSVFLFFSTIRGFFFISGLLAISYPLVSLPD